MSEVGAEMAELLGIVLTHEHGDHSAGLKTFVKKRKCAVFASHGTKDALEAEVALADWRGSRRGRSGRADVTGQSESRGEKSASSSSSGVASAVSTGRSSSSRTGLV